MVFNIKNFLAKQSIIQLTLFKVIFSIFAFLIILILLYGQNFWEKQILKFNYNLLLSASNVQTKIQSQIISIEELKKDKDLTKTQKILKIDDIIQPIINKYNDNLVGYYDVELNIIIKNQNETDISFNEVRTTIGAINEFNNLSNNNKVISVNIPIYDKEKLVGYVWAYTKNADYVFSSFYNFNDILILVLSLSVLIIFLIRKHIKQIELCLEEFSKMIINNGEQQEQILIKLPELRPILYKISCFTDGLKRMNLELESSKRQIDNIMEGISDGFYAIDREWQFTFVNNETQKIMSVRKTDLIGKNIWEIFPQGIGSLTYDKLQEAMSLEESIHWEATGFIKPDQYYEYHAYPFEEGLTVFFRDITVLKRQQLEFARLERLNLIGQLAAGISHEIRNPLTTVKGFLQMFGSKSKYEQDKENMDLMVSEIDRANEIITDFLSLAKANLDNIKPRNINEVINKVFPMLQADAFSNNKEVVFDLNKLPDIMINENEIKQLILNLVRNALEVTPEQGSVIISTYLKENKVVLAIIDHGTGIPQDVQEKIGTPFFTTKETGTGLGLAISMGIAQRHKAIFNFKTGSDGTVFYIIFPTFL
ncbi:ATP-binding protein [Desulfosporosinus sp. BG]|uniref:two-component system sensor histidine kinase NtrB n=1 Tax=Desulfosporosinus sp. BG TaxID=1633135 RepID=UPI00083AEE79|nr:ATP-binding protein [Desulfosporosinus sp. BG]ODA40522.1 Sporulation kinase [Desulfosporosinus sp. BG]